MSERTGLEKVVIAVVLLVGAVSLTAYALIALRLFGLTCP